MSKETVKTQIDTDITNKITSKSISPSNVGSNMKAVVDLIPETSYKIYTAFLSQTGTNAPVETVFENTLGTIVWTRFSPGRYFATISGGNMFTINKTLSLPDRQIIAKGPAGQFWSAYIDRFNDNSVCLYTTVDHIQTDSLIYNLFIEIRVYN